ncbi:Oidioi.mRNA.OKI2018_I69.chr2.g4507.t1.cds [Oikopleura dioica]|uniref:Oidioi.mRNA.OKI2018_I69.chr2.g4507.t1.cds n=1 Tax=Oikopleura dioica TaxID=34765 RepID=A0ABN7T306_OIKDI|nr:Oidioi.mRNA.OKI2018_I69.chr2.g4507.t1.cds [Oikopleura dioica]
MKFFAGLVLAAQASTNIALGTLVDNWCGFDLHDFYETTGLALEYRVKPRKTWENRDEEKIAKRPRGPSHYRDVVRVNCAVNTRGGSNHENFTPLGGYPTQKIAPMVKCTRKGPNGTQKLKPNARRWRGNKIVDWYQKNCL